MTIQNLAVWVFEPDWGSGIVESLEFFTNILTSKTGAEQRLAHRDTPRRMIELDMTVANNERAYLERFIGLAAGGKFYMPIFFDPYETTDDVVSGTDDVFMSTDGMMLAVDDLIMLKGDDPFTYELAEIQSFNATKLVTKSNILLNWPAGTKVLKISKAQFLDQTTLDEISHNISTGPVKVLVMDDNPLSIQNTRTAAGPMVKANTKISYGAALYIDTEIETGTAYVSHSYHDTTDPTGRTEEQFMMAAAMFAAYDALRTETTDEYDEAARYYQDLGKMLLDAVGDGVDVVPILRYPVFDEEMFNYDTFRVKLTGGTYSTTFQVKQADGSYATFMIPDGQPFLNLPHYRFAARSNAAIGVTLLEQTLEVNDDNSLFITDYYEAGTVYERIWKIYPTTAELFINQPWMPAYDLETPTVDVSFDIVDWTVTDTGIEVPIPVTAPDDLEEWNVVYSYESNNALDVGEAFQLLPSIRPVRTQTAIYSGETSHWFERALSRAATMDDRENFGNYWRSMQYEFRKTDLKGRRIDDQRWIFEQLPLVDALPSLDDVPTGFFCYSDHPEAVAPVSVAGADAAWTGYNFWSRDDNGDLIGETDAPGVLSRVQFGRLFSDQWRPAQTYQDADHYLYVSLACSRKPVLGNGEYFLVWVSSKTDDTEEDRWFADIGSKAAFVATTLVSGNVIEFLIPITDFKRRSYDGAGVSVWGTALTSGQILKSFGISAEFNNDISIRMRSMRLVSGSSGAWVTSNLAKALKGYPMAYAPGVSPTLMTLHVDQQRFGDDNFSPLHGFQFPDFWKIAETDANSIYSGLTVNDLPVPSRTTNLITYPIAASTTGGTTKTPAALLMEQQLTFLDHAQKQWQADGGTLGPFAHTYTMNTYDRLLFDDTAHSQWVYENVRPYTQWGGFQYRIAEGLAQTIEAVGTTAVYADSKTLAVTLLTNFMSWLNTAWPNLDGIWAGFDGLRVFSGDEADYAKRFTGDENPFMESYEDQLT